MQKVQSGEISQEQVQRMADGELKEEELEEGSGGSLIFIIVMSAVALGAGAAFITLTLGRW